MFSLLINILCTHRIEIWITEFVVFCNLLLIGEGYKNPILHNINYSTIYNN